MSVIQKQCYLFYFCLVILRGSNVTESQALLEHQCSSLGFTLEDLGQTPSFHGMPVEHLILFSLVVPLQIFHFLQANIHQLCELTQTKHQ